MVALRYRGRTTDPTYFHLSEGRQITSGSVAIWGVNGDSRCAPNWGEIEMRRSVVDRDPREAANTGRPGLH
jgi:hypothetical protein